MKYRKQQKMYVRIIMIDLNHSFDLKLVDKMEIDIKFKFEPCRTDVYFLAISNYNLLFSELICNNNKT